VTTSVVTVAMGETGAAEALEPEAALDAWVTMAIEDPLLPREDVELCADDTREPEPEPVKCGMIEELEGDPVAEAVDVVPRELLPEPAVLLDVVGMTELEVLKRLDELEPVEELGKEEELDGGAELDGRIEVLELVVVVFSPGPQGPVSMKFALTPPVVPELVTVITSQKSGKTIRSLKDTRVVA
jgi:hypothetical protein